MEAVRQGQHDAPGASRIDRRGVIGDAPSSTNTTAPAASGSDCQAGSANAACFVDVTVDPPAVSGLALTGSTLSPLVMGVSLLAILAGLALAASRAMRNRREI